MKQVKLAPDARQASALERTLPAINEVADRVSATGFEHLGLKASVRELRRLCYGELKTRGFGAQASQHIIKRVADAYTTMRANIRAGNLATTSDGTNHQGRRLDRYRRRQARKRAELQAKRTRSAKQLLKKRARRESRHATHVNHKIAKTVVAVAQRTERGIALEDLQGIRERVTVSRDQRARLSTWPFHRLGAFIAYKARRAGVPYIEVDPAYTSQRCPRCGHTARNNRSSRDHFRCRRCGLAWPADHVAGVNVRDRARSAWVFVTMSDPVPT